MAAGAIDNPAGRFRMTSFGRLWPEFYLLCDYLKNYHTVDTLESNYQLASSSIADLLPHALKDYLTMLSIMLMHPWPTFPEQVQAISTLHPLLALENIIFLVVDTSKTTNVDSTNLPTRALHWSDNKGFGLVLSIFTTILGGLMWLEVNWNGNSEDTTTYAASAPYLTTKRLYISSSTHWAGRCTI